MFECMSKYKMFWKAFVIVSHLFVSSVAMADAPGEGKDVKTFSLNSDAHFSDYKKRIERLIKKRGVLGATNDFCVIGFVNEDATKSVRILWEQRQKIYLWEGEDEELDVMRGRIDLHKDVVNSEDDLHGSTYLVTKEWVDDLAKICERAGEKLTFPSSKKSKNQ